MIQIHGLILVLVLLGNYYNCILDDNNCYNRKPPTCSRLKFNSGYVNERNVKKLNEYYDKYSIINIYLCDNMNDTIKQSYCYDTTYYKNNFYDKMGSIINKLYYNSNIICNSRHIIFDTSNNTLVDELSLHCEEFDKENRYHFIRGIIIDFINHIIFYALPVFLLLELRYLYIKYKVKNKNSIDYYTNKVTNITDSCIICHEDYTALDDIRKLKCCNHMYHKKCINEWIIEYNHSECPLCKLDINKFL